MRIFKDVERWRGKLPDKSNVDEIRHDIQYDLDNDQLEKMLRRFEIYAND